MAQKASPAASSPCLMITPDDIHLFSEGAWQRGWEKMGAHPDVQNGVEGWRFCVWAPDVTSVHVIGEFNEWNPEAHAMFPIEKSGLWQCFVAGAEKGQLYKYLIETKDGEKLYKADPYAFYSECPPGTASRLWTIDGYAWKDGRWMNSRKKRDHMHSPLNIYEVHLGSWKRHGDEPQGEPREDGTYPGPGDPFPAQRGEFYSYDDLSEELVDYVKTMGYTHIEAMPVLEHPFDGSWGYQPTGYFAATSRYGTPQQFMHFVESCHKAGIGVILDWVPGGFCADAQGLSTFNGKMLYEREIHPNWGTHKFDFGRPEVVSFLISNALFWVECFHADGIRMDGVSSMLYLNFGVDNPADKKFNKYGTEEDLDASAFIRKVNTVIGETHPDVMMIAEESTAWPLVTYPPADGGLGFHFKWDMGWMNDTLHYMQTDFPWRPGNHRMLTFSIMYSFNENFVLPLSHDEVVNGKCSLIGRMPGDQWRQFAGLRTLALYQMTHPGAKLNFMGNELGMYIEWRYYEALQWFLAKDFEAHAKQQSFIEALNHFYLDEPAMWENAYDADGFEWIDANNDKQSIISFVRHGKKEKDDLVVIINFDPASYETFRMGVPREGDWKLVFNSDSPAFGGSGDLGVDVASSQPAAWNGCKDSIEIALPGLSGLVYKRIGKSSYVPPKPAVKKTVCTRKAPTAKPAAAKQGAQTKPTQKAPATSAKDTASKPKTLATRVANESEVAAEPASPKAPAAKPKAASKSATKASTRGASALKSSQKAK